LRISSIDWEFIWQGHQEIMATLAVHGNRVLFVENTGGAFSYAPKPATLQATIFNWWPGIKGFRRERAMT